MRSIKKLSFAAVTALLVMAFIGVASASAATVVCTTPDQSCAGADIYAGNVTATLAAHNGETTAELQSATLGTVICTTASSTGTIDTNPGSPVTGTVTPSWDNCTTAGGLVNCTSSPANTPYSASILSVGDGASPPDPNADGSFSVGDVDVTVSCGLVACTYTAANNAASTYNPGSAAAPDPSSPSGQIYYDHVALTSPNCLNDNGTFTANYSVTQEGGGDLYVQ